MADLPAGGIRTGGDPARELLTLIAFYEVAPGSDGVKAQLQAEAPDPPGAAGGRHLIRDSSQYQTPMPADPAGGSVDSL